MQTSREPIYVSNVDCWDAVEVLDAEILAASGAPGFKSQLPRVKAVHARARVAICRVSAMKGCITRAKRWTKEAILKLQLLSSCLYRYSSSTLVLTG